MKFLDSEMHNFGPFIHAKIKLDDRGLMLILGDNQLSSSADSNGSGKSYVCEGIAYPWYGESIRGTSPDRVVNRKAKKNCITRGRAEANGQLLEVLRYREMKAKHGHKTPDGKDVPTGSGLLLYVDGIDKTEGTTSLTQAAINSLLGIDFATFKRSIYFDGKDVKQFPTMTDGEIKAVFEKVLGLDDLQKVSKAIKARRDTEGAKSSGLQSELNMTNATISTANMEIIEAQSRVDRHEVDRASKAEEKTVASLLQDNVAGQDWSPTRRSIEKEDAEATALLAEFDGLDILIANKNTEITEATILLNGHTSSLALHQRDRSNVSAFVNPTTAARLNDAKVRLAGIERDRHGITAATTPEFTRAIAEATARRDQAERTYNEHYTTAGNAQSKIGTPCTGCGKTYEPTDLESIIAHARGHAASADVDRRAAGAELEILDDMISSFRVDLGINIGRSLDAALAEIAAIQAEIDADCVARVQQIDNHIALCRNSIALAEAATAGHKDKLAKLMTLVARRGAVQARLAALPAAKSELATAEAAVSAALVRKAEIEAEKASILAAPNPYVTDVERWQARLADAKLEYTMKLMTFQEAQVELAHLDFLMQAYSNAGLKAHIYATVTPALNERANFYAGMLADGAVKIEFVTSKVNKDGSISEKFGVTVDNAEGGEGYLDNSSGERKKIDLAIAFAISDIVAGRSSKPIDLWVADEIAESLDPTALDRVVLVLEEIAKVRGTVFVISHTDMSAHIANTITVQKTAAGSTIV